MLQGVIFDMDGVLVDTEPLSDSWHMSFAAAHGVAMDLAELKACRGLSGPDMWARLCSRYRFGYSAEEMVVRARMGFLVHLETLPGLAPAPGVRTLMQALHAAGLPLAVGSAASRIRIETLTRRFEMTPLLQATVSFQDVALSKPAPDIYLEAARRLGCAPDSLLVFEDSPTGIQAARAAGMRVLRYTGYVSDPEQLHQADGATDDFAAWSPTRLQQWFAAVASQQKKA